MRDLVINSKVIDELERAKRNNRLMHIYLFHGDDIKEMVDTAFMFACNLYCGCLNCDICKNILDDNHLNVNYLSIQEDKTMITKEQISSLIDNFSKTSLIQGPRIYIINGIETSSTAAQNSLLKFIEDPNMQDDCFGILIAKNINMVLSTIKSRCGLFYFPSKTDSEVEKEFAKIYNADEAFMLSSLVKNTLDAKNMNDNKDYLFVKDMFYRFISLKNAKEAILFFLEFQYLSSERFNMFLKILIKFYNCSLFSPKLISSIIYGKIKEINSLFSNKEKEERLKFLLEIEEKQRFNIISRNLLHQIIVYMF